MTEEHKEIVRLATSCWRDERGIHIKKSLIRLKRKSYGFQTLQYYFSEFGDDEGGNIINLYQVQDGVYSVEVINVSRDWETGYVDTWEYKLVPYNVDGTKKVSGNDN